MSELADAPQLSQVTPCQQIRLLLNDAWSVGEQREARQTSGSIHLTHTHTPSLLLLLCLSRTRTHTHGHYLPLSPIYLHVIYDLLPSLISTHVALLAV